MEMPGAIRRFIKRTPLLYRPAKRMRDQRAKDLLCRRSTDLCIEGYESSGNSFSYAILRVANGKLRIAHHCHSVANLKLALHYGVPAVCLIRHPEAAISSRLARFGGTREDAVREYIDFHRFILRHIDSLVIVTFEELTQDTQRFLERLRQEAAVDLPFDDVEELKERAVRRMKERSSLWGAPEVISLPLETRETSKAQIQQELRNCPDYREAVAVWERIIQHTRS